MKVNTKEINWESSLAEILYQDREILSARDFYHIINDIADQCFEEGYDQAVVESSDDEEDD